MRIENRKIAQPARRCARLRLARIAAGSRSSLPYGRRPGSRLSNANRWRRRIGRPNASRWCAQRPRPRRSTARGPETAMGTERETATEKWKPAHGRPRPPSQGRRRSPTAEPTKRCGKRNEHEPNAWMPPDGCRNRAVRMPSGPLESTLRSGAHALEQPTARPLRPRRSISVENLAATARRRSSRGGLATSLKDRLSLSTRGDPRIERCAGAATGKSANRGTE